GGQTVTATDTASGSSTGTSGRITVSAAATTHLAVSAPPRATGGAAFLFTVAAVDPLNNTATADAGAVQVRRRGGQAAPPGDSTLTGGFGSFIAPLKTPGGQTLTATDTTSGSITGTSGPITVTNSANTPHLVVSAPGTATAGAPFSMTVSAVDQSGNVMAGYR